MNDLKCMCGVGMSGYCAVHKHGWAYQLPQQASQPDPKQYPLSSGARAAFEHGYAEGTKDSAPRPDPKDPAETFRQGWEAGCANHRDLLKQLREGAARFEELEKERDRLQARMEDDERFRAESASVRDAATKELQLAVVDRDHQLAQSSDELRRVVASWKAEEEEWNNEMAEVREANQRVDAEAARMREALERIQKMDRRAADWDRQHNVLAYADGPCGQLAREALASTTAGTLALGVIEAARKAAHEARMAKQPHIAELLERNLQAYDQATPHLINTGISRDSDCQCMLIGNQTEPDINLDCPAHGKRKDGGETPGGTDGQG